MGALRVFCPNGWIEINAADNTCVGCGFRLGTFDALSYEAKLLLALKNPLHERRMLAIQLLGELQSSLAVSAFATVVDHEHDPYILRTIAYALARIGGDAATALLSRLISHPSVIVRLTAEDACQAMPGGASGLRRQQSFR